MIDQCHIQHKKPNNVCGASIDSGGLERKPELQTNHSVNMQSVVLVCWIYVTYNKSSCSFSCIGQELAIKSTASTQDVS